MGRPLFSQSYRSTPTVRTEPDSSFLSYKRWSHWDAFDPDSEEFIENDPVYEAFVDPPISATSGEEEEQVLAAGETISSGSSELSASDRGSPMALGDDPVRMLADAYPSVDWEQRLSLAGQSPVTPRFAARGEAQSFVRGDRQRSATFAVVSGRLPSAAFHSGLTPTNPSDNRPRTSNITPISVSSRPMNYTPPSHPIPPGPFRPSTPPPRTIALDQMTTPSPAPAVTSRILSWSSRAPITPTSPSPGNSPLTNPNARMSLSHIVPTFVHVRDVVI